MPQNNEYLNTTQLEQINAVQSIRNAETLDDALRVMNGLAANGWLKLWDSATHPDGTSWRDKSPISQNEQQEAVAVLNSLWGSDTGWQYNIKLLPSFETDKYLESIDGHDIYLYLSPTKQIPDGWISTKDRLPDQLELKIKLIDGSEIYAWYQSDGDYYWNCGGSEIFIDESKVTHWMPLPSAPTNTEVGE